MMTANDVREVSFGKSVSGYNKEEVDVFLDKVEEDYKKYEAYVASLNEKITALTNEAAEYKASSASVQTVLISAQQLADKIVNDAKAQAETIKAQSTKAAEEATAEAKNMLENFDQKLAVKRAEAESELAKEVEKSKKEQDAIKLVTDEIIKKQQASFDRMKIEIAQFKKNIIGQYKDQLELISKLPDDIVMDAARVAKAIEYEIENEEKAEPQPVAEPEPVEEKKQTPQEIFEIDAKEVENEMNNGGFVVNADEEDAGDEEGFSNDFFNLGK